MRKRYLVVIAAMLAGCEAAPAADADASATTIDSASAPRDTAPADLASVVASDTVLTPDGWNRLRIGMTRAEVVAASGEDAYPEAAGGPDPATCDEFRPTDAPDGLLVMIRNGRLSRISISEGTGITSAEGIAVGDSIQAVQTAFGSTAVSSPHAYHEAPAQYLAVWRAAPPSAGARGILFEIDGTAHVRRILAGDESIGYPEGCV